MLLPEAFQRSPRPEGLLAFDETDRMVLGAAAYHFQGPRLVLRRLRVVRAHRRQGVARALLQHLTAIAAERSLDAIRAHADTHGSPEVETFLRASGFTPLKRLRVAQIESETALRVLVPLRERLVAAGRVPGGVRVVHPAEAPVEEVARLCAAHMESEWSVHPSFFRASVFAEASRYSFVLMVGDAVAGCLITEGAPGVAFARITAHVVAPDYRRGWANIFLLATALERSAKAGVRTVAFEALEDNLDTVNLIRRLGGETVQMITGFELAVRRE
jgi:GNAT superfamily N-acetyltransferase